MRLTPEAADHLRKLLGMLGSAHDGEVLNAARLAVQFLRRHGLQWADIIAAPQPPPPPSLPEWQDMALACEQHDHLLNDRERDFVFNMSRSWRPPSDKQLAWLEALYMRILECAA